MCKFASIFLNENELSEYVIDEKETKNELNTLFKIKGSNFG